MEKEDKWYCVIRSLADSQAEPKLLPANELYRIKDSKCYTFKPRSKKFDKHEEFGVRDGDKLVKHVVLAMDSDPDKLQSVLKTKRSAAPVRLSISATELPLKDFTFPNLVKAQRIDSKTRKENRREAVHSDDGKVLQLYREQRELEQLEVVKAGNGGNVEESIKNTGPEPINESLQDLVSLMANEQDEEKNDKKKKNKNIKKKRRSKKELSDDKEGSVDNCKWEVSKADDISDGTDDLIEDNQTNSVEVDGDGANFTKHESVPDTSAHHDKDNDKECASCLSLTQDLNISKQRLSEAYAKIKDKHEETKSLKEELKAKNKEIESLKDKLEAVKGNKFDEESLLSKLNSMLKANVTDDQHHMKRSRKSRLDELPSNLVDKESVDSTKVKVGKKLYVKKTHLVKLEEEHAFFTARVEALIHLFYGQKAHKYSVKSSSRYWISDEHLASMETILTHLKWNRTTSFSLDKIRTRVIKYTSHLRINEAKGKEKKKTAKESSGSSSGSSSESEEKEEKLPKRKLTPSAPQSQAKKLRASDLSDVSGSNSDESDSDKSDSDKSEDSEIK